MPVACSVASEIRVTKVQPPSPGAFPRQQTQPADRSSATASTVAALVIRQRRMEVERLVVASVGVEVVPTAVRSMPLALTLVLVEGAHVAMR
jgi:hypothetical protein